MAGGAFLNLLGCEVVDVSHFTPTSTPAESSKEGLHAGSAGFRKSCCSCRRRVTFTVGSALCKCFCWLSQELRHRLAADAASAPLRTLLDGCNCALYMLLKHG